MKKILLLILLPFITFAQLEHDGELTIELNNYGSSWDVTFTLTAIGPVWDDNYELTDDYESVSDNISSSSPSEVVAYFDHIITSWAGINPIFAVGLYKISAIENGTEQAYFYMDWRTSNWNSSLDVTFEYDVGNKRFRDNGDTKTIDYSYQTLWELTENLLETSDMEDYWDICLVMFEDDDDHPRIAWGTYNDISYVVQNYKVYRKISASSTPPALSNWGLAVTLDDDVWNWIDTGYSFGGDLYAHYYVVATIQIGKAPATSDTTNVVTTGIAFNKVNMNKHKVVQDHRLEQNYPNPFNPSTIITWQSPVDNFVTLKVFDILGKEVATLVSDYKEAGTHSVEFNGSDLPSGVYLYSIQIGNYVENRKIILQK